MIENIGEIFRNRNSKIIGKYNKSAVLIPMIEDEGEIKILFEVRALNLKHQPGDVCLPGGKMEKGEKPMITAIRETVEELNVKEEDIEILGEMDYVVSPYNFIIYPYVGKIKKQVINPNKDEVNNVFEVPLEYFLNTEPEVYYGELISNRNDDFPYDLIINGKDYEFRKGRVEHNFYRYEDYTIWGYTALIMKHFTDLIRDKI